MCKIRKVIRFILIFMMVFWHYFKPIRLIPEISLANGNGVFQVGVKNVDEGMYALEPIDDTTYSGYQITTSWGMTLESTIEAHCVTSKRYIKLEKGEYIKLINCSARKIS